MLCVSHLDADLQNKFFSLTLLFGFTDGAASGDEQTSRKCVVQSDETDGLPKQRNIPTVTRMF